MQNICALDPNQKSMEKLLNCKCFPVRTPNRDIIWMARNEEFAIVDRSELENLFTGKIKMLDFSLEEVHDIDLFFHALGLQTCYLSKLTSHETKVFGSTAAKTRNLIEHLRGRAFAIARYAIHSRASKDSIPNILSVIGSAEVYTSDNIENVISITQDGQRATASTMAYVHIKLRTIISIYTSRKADVVVTGIIDDARIEAPEFNDEEDEDDYSSGDEEQGVGTHQLTVTSRYEGGSLNSRGKEEWGVGTHQLATSSGYEGGSSSSRSASGVLATSVVTFPELFCNPDLYKQLIDVVIWQTEAIDGFPDDGYSVCSTLSSPFLNTSTSQAVSSRIPMEREFNIGTAGELFVFEFLSGLNLLGFDRPNWQSNIRDRISIHENTATSGRSPKYYIEVKATMSRLDTAFHAAGDSMAAWSR
ncbi:hypothetical protein BP6252_00903 [Coleophoma cylindrospora]|uniref:Uncharacterized protein n=1 Tax=Coleophoma cylindrospora TaxID=1849047 RepID=A0A3D8SRS0_9HELO|nr:hypothetical protein BP6252_00903 [Coleophoma cylindrospora]